MEVYVEITKKFTSDNSRIFRLNDTIEFSAVKEDGVVSVFRGVIVDITEEEVILKDATIDGTAVSSNQIVKYSAIKENTCKFVLK